MNETPQVANGSVSSDLLGTRSIRRAILYFNMHMLFVSLAALDIIVTWKILHLGGHELNAMADWIIRNYDVPGVVLYKFALVLFVVSICEITGRRNRRTGLFLARWAVALTAFPVVVGLVHLLATFAEPGR